MLPTISLSVVMGGLGPQNVCRTKSHPDQLFTANLGLRSSATHHVEVTRLATAQTIAGRDMVLVFHKKCIDKRLLTLTLV